MKPDVTPSSKRALSWSLRTFAARSNLGVTSVGSGVISPNHQLQETGRSSARLNDSARHLAAFGGGAGLMAIRSLRVRAVTARPAPELRR
jgi:hypothetical protein